MKDVIADATDLPQQINKGNINFYQ